MPLKNVLIDVSVLAQKKSGVPIYTENLIDELLKLNSDSININLISSTPTPKFNKKLGLKRANAVIDYIVLNYNISPDRLNATTKGEEEPLSTVTHVSNGLEGAVNINTLAEINRRVDFEIAD